MLIILRNFLILLSLFFSLSFTVSAVGVPQISASSAVVIDADTCEILYEKNAYEKRSMASTTKIMTGIIAVESGRLEESVRVSEKIYVEGTAVGFEKGEVLTLYDLCHALLLESGNDAAVLIAKFLAGDEKSFSAVMNNKAAELNMNNTSFVTASGLDAKNHYTTAYDMALLGAHSIKNQAFREICSKKSYRAKFVHPEKERYFYNHNRFLTMYDGAIGIKTGFTKKSGRCLVSACLNNGKLLVAVTLNAPDDWNDHKKLFDYGYSLYESRSFQFDVSSVLPLYGSDKKAVAVKTPGAFSLTVLKNSHITEKVFLNKLIYAPVEKGDVLGKIVVLQNGMPIFEREICSAENVSKHKEYKIKKENIFKALFKKIFKKDGIQYDRR